MLPGTGPGHAARQPCTTHPGTRGDGGRTGRGCARTAARLRTDDLRMRQNEMNRAHEESVARNRRWVRGDAQVRRRSRSVNSWRDPSMHGDRPIAGRPTALWPTPRVTPVITTSPARVCQRRPERAVGPQLALALSLDSSLTARGAFSSVCGRALSAPPVKEVPSRAVGRACCSDNSLPLLNRIGLHRSDVHAVHGMRRTSVLAALGVRRNHRGNRPPHRRYLPV